MDRERAQELLTAVADAQRAFWAALRELEGELGRDLDNEDGSDFTDMALEDLLSEDRETISNMPREQVVELLAGVSIECRDDETDEELREALLVNVIDGTIPADALEVL